MAQPPSGGIPPPPPPTFRRTTSNTIIVLAVVLALVVGVAFFVIFALIGFGIPGLSFAPFCGIGVIVLIIIVVVIVAAATGAWGGTRLPPPPPIQQPMVPAGMQGPIALSCPNCGAPPQAVDRFGVATCPYCNTRYLVR